MVQWIEPLDTSVVISGFESAKPWGLKPGFDGLAGNQYWIRDLPKVSNQQMEPALRKNLKTDTSSIMQSFYGF